MTITSLEIFKNMCTRHGVEYIENEDPNYMMQGSPVIARLRDTRNQAHSRDAYLVRQQGAIKLLWDNDANYSAMTKRIGSNGGVLTRDYTTEVIKQTSQRAGGFIMSEEHAPDGSVLLKVGVA